MIDTYENFKYCNSGNPCFNGTACSSKISIINNDIVNDTINLQIVLTVVLTITYIGLVSYFFRKTKYPLGVYSRI